LNRRAVNAKALARVTSCGGRIAVSYPADGRILPVIVGLNGGQMFDPGARIHIQLLALSYVVIRPVQRTQSLFAVAGDANFVTDWGKAFRQH
jgi:hypothetical protein